VLTDYEVEIMKIDEVTFNRPWNLVSGTDRTKWLEAEVRRHVGRGLIEVWEKSGDSDQLVCTFENNGYWEVHHIRIKNGQVVKAGTSSDISTEVPNIGFISTAKDIYMNHLNRGRKIKITTIPSLWPSYKKFIEKIVLDSNGARKLGTFNPNDVSFDGEPCLSQIVESRGKFTSITGLQVPQNKKELGMK
jgi:hypothetical protein